MENVDQPYGFLKSEDSRVHFAGLDLALKAGRHIQNYAPDTQLYAYCEDNYEELQGYYANLFLLDFCKGYYALDAYYYLQLREEERSKIPSSMIQVMDSVDVILGILLLNFAEEKFLELSKLFTLEDLWKMLWAPEHKEHMQRLFNKGGDESFNNHDSDRLKARLSRSLARMENQGWIRSMDKAEVKRYEVMPSLGRLEAFFGKEIGGVDGVPVNAEETTALNSAEDLEQ